MSTSPPMSTSDHKETEALIKEPAKPSTDKTGGAPVSSSTFNLANTIIGCGILTLPYNLKCCGYVLGMFFLLLAGVASSYTFHLLSIASEHVSTYSYREVAKRLYSPKFGTFVAVCVALYTMGSIASYCIVIRDNVFWWPDAAAPNNRTYKILFMWGCMLFIILPLSLAPKLDFLSFTSLVALCAIFYVICVVITFFVIVTTDPTAGPEKEAPVAVNIAVDALTTFPLFNTAFCAHYNVLNIYRELQLPTVKRMDKVIMGTAVITIAFNSIMALFGYFAFTDTVASDVTRNIASLKGGTIFFYIANVAMIIVMLFSYPLLQFAIRRVIESIFWKEDAVVPKKWRYSIIVFLILFPPLIASFVDSIDQILSFSASLFGTPITFIFPGMFVMTINKRHKKQGEPYSKRQYFLSITTIALGTFYMLSGFLASVYTYIIEPNISNK